MQRVATATLKNLNNLERLNELFCRDLNYGYSGSVISKRTWKEQVANSVKELALIGTQGDFHIIYCQIEKLLLGIERPIINQLLKEHPYLLAIFSDPQFTNWHFVNVKYDEELKNRRLFRRIVIGPDERLHTAAQRINMLEVVDEKISPLELQIEHDKAFDVEEVTKEFYNKFTEIFHILDKDIAEENPQLDTAKQAQIILNRLIFLYFIQKKGWLNNNKRYLYENFLTYWKKNPEGNSFYSDFLFELFQALSSQDNLYKDILGNVPFLNGGLFEVDPFPISPKLQPRLVIKNSTFKQIFDYLLERFNFTVREDTPLDIEVAIDPEMLGKIFENLILKLEKGEDLRKKTGSYYTPRVIVHFMCQQSLKEYLGSESEIDKSKIESLFTMGPADQLSEEELKKLESLISIPQARLLKSLIKKAYILDPAVGSGAFLVGMLHEMFSIIKLSDIREFGQEYIQRSNYNYELKRELIETSLCGVDIQDQAVRICELRLWLSLIVDYEKVEGEDVPPLPNLNYKIRCGDSLIEKLFGHNVQLDQLVQTDKGRQLIDEIREIKEDYFLEPNIQEKFRLELRALSKQCELLKMLIKTKIDYVTEWVRIQPDFFGVNAEEKRQREEKQKQLTEYEFILSSVSNKQKKVEAMLKGKIPKIGENIHQLRQSLGISFIWKLDFAEVFKEKGGFDVVIANPPYVRADRGVAHLKYRDEIMDSKMYQTLWEKWDIYIPFIERGMKLLKEDGILEFIVSDAYMTSKYAERSHDWFAQNKTIKRIDFFPSMKIFDAEIRNIIIQLQNKKNEDNHPQRVKHEKAFENISLLPTGSQKKWSRNIFRVDFTEEKKFEFEDTISLGDICYISYGLRPSSDERYARGEFKKADLISSTHDKVHCRKYVEGKDIDKYRVDRIRYLEWGTERSPKRLVRPTFSELYEPPKILRGRMTGATYDNQKLLCNDSIFVIVLFDSLERVNNKSIQTSISKFNKGRRRSELEVISRDFDLKYLLAIINSKFAKYFLNSIRRSQIGFYPDDIRKVPIKSSNQSTQKEFVALVDTILSIYMQYGYPLPNGAAAKVKDLENQIDQKIYELYELTDEEIALVEENAKL